MDAFDRHNLLNDKISISLIIAHMISLMNNEENQLDKYGPFKLKSEAGQRKKRNIEKTIKLLETLFEAHKLMRELHEDNVCANTIAI